MAKGRTAIGEAHGKAKLTEVEAMEIFKLVHAGGLFQREIAEFYGVGPRVVSQIKHKETWGHIHNA